MRLDALLVIGGVAALAYLMDPTRKISRIAQAIARAEGYGVPGAIPTVRNNPGNIRGADGEIIRYKTPEEGWAALYRQVTLMLTGESRWYKPEMTIREIGRIYVGEAGWENWVRNVSAFLGVSPDTRLRDV